MLYPSREPSDLHAIAYGLVGDSVVDLHGLRQLLTTFDRQFFPSPVSIRFGPSDIVTHELENGMTIFLDRDDGAVSRPAAQWRLRGASRADVPGSSAGPG